MSPNTRILCVPSIHLQGGGEDPESMGQWVQVSRLGMPLANEAAIPRGMKDRFNNSLPIDDGQFLSYVVDPERARLLNTIYGLTVPPTPRDDLVSIFLTGIPGVNMPPGVTPSEQLRLNMAIKPGASPVGQGDGRSQLLCKG